MAGVFGDLNGGFHIHPGRQNTGPGGPRIGCLGQGHDLFLG